MDISLRKISVQQNVVKLQFPKCRCSWQVPDHEELSSMARILAEGLYQGSDQQDVYQIGSYKHSNIKGEV
jgi:hypothetical protein